MDSYSHILTESGLIEAIIEQKTEFILKLRKIIDKCELYIYKNNLQLEDALNYLMTKQYDYLDFRCASYSPLSPHPTKDHSIVNPFDFEPDYSVFEDFSEIGIKRFEQSINTSNKGFSEVILHINSLIELYKSDIKELEKKSRIMWGYFYNEPKDKRLLFKSHIDDRLNVFNLDQDSPPPNEINLPKGKFSNLALLHNDLPVDIKKINDIAQQLIRSGEKNIKSVIVEKVNNLYDEKYSKLETVRSKSYFLRFIYPFIEHNQDDWNFEKFFNFAKN